MLQGRQKIYRFSTGTMGLVNSFLETSLAAAAAAFFGLYTYFLDATFTGRLLLSLLLWIAPLAFVAIFLALAAKALDVALDLFGSPGLDVTAGMVKYTPRVFIYRLVALLVGLVVFASMVGVGIAASLQLGLDK